nr:hypothetical protein [Azospirillum sp. TSO22-1]
MTRRRATPYRHGRGNDPAKPGERRTHSMIYDCFTFYNEFEVLDLRLRELAGVVDRFVLVEADTTHAGLPKPLFFEERKAEFAPYLDRITHIVVRDMPETTDSWVRENFQRNAIMRGLDGLKPDDIVLISDVDEIPRRSVIASLPGNGAVVSGLRMPLFYFKYNYLNIAGNDCMVVWTVAVRGSHIAQITPQGARNARFALSQNPPANTRVYPHAGWHFSYIGDVEHVQRKLRNFAHQEYNDERFIEAIDIDRIVASGADLYGRAGYAWTTVQADDYFPDPLRANFERYRPFVAEGAQHRIQTA